MDSKKRAPFIQFEESKSCYAVWYFARKETPINPPAPNFPGETHASWVPFMDLDRTCAQVKCIWALVYEFVTFRRFTYLLHLG